MKWIKEEGFLECKQHNTEFKSNFKPRMQTMSCILFIDWVQKAPYPKERHKELGGKPKGVSWLNELDLESSLKISDMVITISIWNEWTKQCCKHVHNHELQQVIDDEIWCS